MEEAVFTLVFLGKTKQNESSPKTPAVPLIPFLSPHPARPLTPSP